MVKWSGLKDINPMVHIFQRFDLFPEKAYLGNLNDEGKSFHEIADLIERSL